MAGHMHGAVLKMPEWMENPISYHLDCMAVFVELPLVSRIGNHTLHDVIAWYEVNEILLISLQSILYLIDI